MNLLWKTHVLIWNHSYYRQSGAGTEGLLGKWKVLIEVLNFSMQNTVEPRGNLLSTFQLLHYVREEHFYSGCLKLYHARLNTQ